jgi:hypothetical protein
MRRRSLGACPRIGILFKMEAFLENKHRHIVNIPSIIFQKTTKSLGKRAFSDRLLVLEIQFITFVSANHLRQLN